MYQQVKQGEESEDPGMMIAEAEDQSNICRGSVLDTEELLNGFDCKVHHYQGNQQQQDLVIGTWLVS